MNIGDHFRAFIFADLSQPSDADARESVQGCRVVSGSCHCHDSQLLTRGENIGSSRYYFVSVGRLLSF